MTPYIGTKALLPVISTHTPTRGVTLATLISDIFAPISTHTPTRGVTLDKSKLLR